MNIGVGKRKTASLGLLWPVEPFSLAHGEDFPARCEEKNKGSAQVPARGQKVSLPLVLLPLSIHYAPGVPADSCRGG